jgi:hypothetical protein
MKLFNSLCLMALLLFGNCTKSNQENPTEVQTISIRGKSFQEGTKLSSLVKSVQIIPLETHNKCLVGDPTQVELTSEFIFYLEYSANSGIRVFSKNGKYIRSIGTKGKGPHEYREILSMSLLPEQEKIFIIDWINKNTIEFNFKGKFIKENKTPTRIGEIRFVSESHYYFSIPYKGFHLHSVNMDTEVTRMLIPHTSTFTGYLGDLNTQADGSHFYSPRYHDSIYRIRGEKVELEYRFDFGPHYCSGTDFRNYTENFKRLDRNEPPGSMVLLGPFFDLGKYFHFSIAHVMNDTEFEINDFLWNKTEQKLICFKDNFDDLLFANSSLESVGPNNEWISIVQPIDLLENLDKIRGNTQFEYSKEFISQIQNLQEDDNPVIVKFTLK